MLEPFLAGLLKIEQFPKSCVAVTDGESREPPLQGSPWSNRTMRSFLCSGCPSSNEKTRGKSKGSSLLPPCVPFRNQIWTKTTPRRPPLAFPFLVLWHCYARRFRSSTWTRNKTEARVVRRMGRRSRFLRRIEVPFDRRTAQVFWRTLPSGLWIKARETAPSLT